MNRPWMPLYIADYLRDTGHLSTLEHGAYLLLIMEYWTKGSLPADEARIARIARVSPREWKGMRDAIAAFFDQDWKHGRIDRELAESRAKYERRANAGRDGGNAKQRNKQSASNATEMLGENPSNDPSNAEAYVRGRGGAQQPQPQSSDEDAALSGRERLDDIEARLREAAGLADEPSPSLCDLSPILGLLDRGMDLGEDILPVIRARRKPGVRTWKFFVQAILDAHATRAAAATQVGTARAPPQRTDQEHKNGVFAYLVNRQSTASR